MLGCKVLIVILLDLESCWFSFWYTSWHIHVHVAAFHKMADNSCTPPFRIFPAVHGNELSEGNERRGRCNFSLLVPKKIRRRGSKKTSDLSTTVTTSTGQDDFENPSHQALQPRPILDALLVSLNFASIKNIFDSVFLLSKPKWAKVSSVTTRFISMSR